MKSIDNALKELTTTSAEQSQKQISSDRIDSLLQAKGYEYYLKNKSRSQKRSKKYYKEHREETLKRVKEWRKNNLEKRKKWLNENRDRLREQARLRYILNKEKRERDAYSK